MTLLKEKTNNKTLRGKGRRLDSERRCEGEHGGGREGKGTQSILSRQCERGRRTKITHPTAGRGVDWMAFSLPLTSLGDVKECSGTLNWTDYKEPLSLSVTMGTTATHDHHHHHNQVNILIRPELNRVHYVVNRRLSTYYRDPLDSFVRSCFKASLCGKQTGANNGPDLTERLAEWKSSTEINNELQFRHKPVKVLYATDNTGCIF